jgi:hypothetical protein
MLVWMVLGIFFLTTFLGLLIWIYFKICRTTKNNIVIGFARVVVTGMVASILGYVFIVYHTEGRKGLRELFIRAGQCFIKGILEDKQ